MILFILILHLSLIIICNWINYKHTNGYFVDEIFVVSVGNIYYEILPCFYFFIFKDELSIFPSVNNIVRQIPLDKAETLCLLNLLYFLCFILADMSIRKNVKFQKKYLNNLNSQTNTFYFLFFLSFAVYGLYQLKGILFGGYTVDYALDDRGFFITALLILFYLALQSYDKYRKKFKLIVFGVLVVLLVTMGTRLIFLSILISCCTYYFSTHRIKMSFFVYVPIIAIIFSIMGILRYGHGTTFLTTEAVLEAFLGEPCYASFSLFSGVLYNDYPIISFPSHFIGDFFNAIPKFIFPEKRIIMNYISSFGYDYNFISPMGAKNVFTSYMESFGIIGTFLFIPFAVFVLHIIKNQNTIAYHCILGSLCFSFFRDPFSMTIVKQIFEISILLPYIFYITQRKYY